MKTLLIILTIVSCKLVAQDTNAVWLKHIDTLAFKLSYTKKMIPKELYTHLSIKKTELANSNEPYRAGCVGSATIPSMQVQYVAIDKHNHYIISIASGGKTHRTLYYFIDKAKGKCNINELFFGNSARLISFGKIVMRVNTKDFKFI